MGAVVLLAPRCLQREGDWQQAFWVVPVLREYSVLNFAAVSAIGLGVGWHDAGPFCIKKIYLNCQAFAQDKQPENIIIFL